MFDTLQYARKLEAAGFTPEQSEIQAEAIKELLNDKLATKSDIVALEGDIAAVKKDIVVLEERLTHRIDQMGYKLTIKLGSMLISAIVILSIFMTFLQFSS